MEENELRTIISECYRADILSRKGQILYSGVDTLVRGKYYFVGFNPACDDSNRELRAILQDAGLLSRKNWSAYTQQCWYPGCGKWNHCCDHGENLHQRQVVKIMQELGQTPETTFSTNLIFFESCRASEVYDRDDFGDLWEGAWRVHQKMLAAVKPDYIVCLGNMNGASAFDLLRRRAISSGTVEKRRITSNSAKSFKRFIGEFGLTTGDTLKSKVVGVPHPSYRYPAAMQWDVLRGFIAG